MPTPIRGIDTITAADALAIVRRACPNDVRPGDTASYVPEIVTLCRAFNVRATILLAQFIHETGNAGPSGRWRDLSPAGLGITTATDTTPYKIIDGTEAAALHVWSMLIALRDWTSAARIILPPSATAWQTRWMRKYEDAACPDVVNVDDLNIIYSGDRATWAVDPDYDRKIIALHAALFGQEGTVTDSSSLVVFGRVPHPAYHDRPIYKAPGVGQDNLGKRTPKGVVWHRMLGTLRGTDGYFVNPAVKALTDYGIGVASVDGADLDGVIYRWNDPLGYQSGWASGPVLAPYGDGAAFVNKYGINAVNRDQVSIETSGQYGTPLTAASRLAIAWLTAYYADQYGIRWDEFPIAPQDGFSFVRWHQEFTGPAEKVCPGEVIIGETADLIAQTAEIMKKYQIASAPIDPPDLTDYARPVTYPWLAADEAARGLDRQINRTTVYYFPQVYEVVNRTPRKQATGNNKKIIGPPIEPGVRFHADYVYRSGNVAYVLTPRGTRVYARDLMPKIQIAKSGTISVRRSADGEPVIVSRPSSDGADQQEG